MSTISLKVPDDELVVWRERSESEGLSLSAWIRWKVNHVQPDEKATPVVEEMKEKIADLKPHVAERRTKPEKSGPIGMCRRCTLIGVPACAECIKAAQAVMPSAVETFGGLE